MEGSSDAHYAENKMLLEKKHKRHFKTPSQLRALEDFYTEHKYPTESMKAELGEKIGLTERQVSGWFCHRRLKDKKKDEVIITPGNKDLSSDVIQDRGSGLRQDSCGSTRQDDLKVADVKEVESHRFYRENLPSIVPNYEPKRPYGGDEMDDTSSESNSALRESFCPPNRSSLDVETPKYGAPSEFVPQYRGRVGPSGYLKIKGQTENAAVTAVKRQLGRHYREDGPPLGIEFDPLPPGAFELPNDDANNDSYRDLENIPSGFVDSAGIHNQSAFNKIALETYTKATEYRSLHRSDQDNFSHGKPNHPFPYQSPSFPSQKRFSGAGSYSTIVYDDRINHSVPYQRDSLGTSAQTFSDKPPRVYTGKSAIGSEEPWRPSYDYANLKVARKRERFDSTPTASAVWDQDHVNCVDDKMASTGILKDEGVYMDRRPMSDRHNSSRLRKCSTEDLKGGIRGREEFVQEDYKSRTSSREPSQWSRRMKGPTVEMPSSLSEDEAAETCSSAD